MLLRKLSYLLVLLLCAQNVFGQYDPKIINFEVKNEGAIISASLHLPPEANGPFPTVIVVPGSDRGTREYFLPYVPAINEVGYAVVLYDKQGVGKSTGDFIQVSSRNSKKTIVERSKIVSSLVKHIRNLDTINGDKIGLLASSQGCWVASEVYRTVEVAFIMNYSGGVASVGESDYYDEIMDDERVSVMDGNNKVKTFTGFKGFDAKNTIKKMEIPVLWMYGELDDSHPGFYDLETLKEMGKPNFRLELLKNTTHDLVDITTNEVSQDMINISMAWMASLLQD